MKWTKTAHKLPDTERLVLIVHNDRIWLGWHSLTVDIWYRGGSLTPLKNSEVKWWAETPPLPD